MNEENTMDKFATELLHEVKDQAKRWFTAFTIIAFLELATIICFMWYISLPIDDVSVDAGEGNATYIGNDLNGGLNNGEGEGYSQGDTK